MSYDINKYIYWRIVYEIVISENGVWNYNKVV